MPTYLDLTKNRYSSRHVVENAKDPTSTNEGFKGFDDPWKVMSPEDRKEANRLFKLTMKAFACSPKQKELSDQLQKILSKYGIGAEIKRNSEYRMDNDSAWTLSAIRSITTKEQFAEAVKWFVKTMKDGNRLTESQHEAIKGTLEDKAEKLGLSVRDLNRKNNSKIPKTQAEYALEVKKLEDEGLTTSDAQGEVDARLMSAGYDVNTLKKIDKKLAKNCRYSSQFAHRFKVNESIKESRERGFNDAMLAVSNVLQSCKWKIQSKKIKPPYATLICVPETEHSEPMRFVSNKINSIFVDAKVKSLSQTFKAEIEIIISPLG